MAPVPDKPDAELRSANGSIDTSLSLTGTRPATITATSWNGSVRLRTERQGPVSIEAESKNGAVHLWLPRGFDGVVTASSGNGNVKLSEALMESAVLVPHEGAGQAWRVKAPGARGGSGGGGGSGGNGGNGGNGGGGGGGGSRKGIRAQAQIEIEFKFRTGSSKSGAPAVPAPPVPPTPPAPPAPPAASAVGAPPKPPVPPAPASAASAASATSTSSTPIPNPFTPTDDKKSLALAYATGDAEREREAGLEANEESVPVHAQWEREDEIPEEKAGPDRVKARTANGNVRIYLADEGEEECSGRCLVM